LSIHKQHAGYWLFVIGNWLLKLVLNQLKWVVKKTRCWILDAGSLSHFRIPTSEFRYLSSVFTPCAVLYAQCIFPTFASIAGA